MGHASRPARDNSWYWGKQLVPTSIRRSFRSGVREYSFYRSEERSGIEGEIVQRTGAFLRDYGRKDALVTARWGGEFSARLAVFQPLQGLTEESIE